MTTPAKARRTRAAIWALHLHHAHRIYRLRAERPGVDLSDDRPAHVRALLFVARGQYATARGLAFAPGRLTRDARREIRGLLDCAAFNLADARALSRAARAR